MKLTGSHTTFAVPLNVSTTEVVVKALLSHAGNLAPLVEEMTPAQRSEYRALMSLARRTAKRKKLGATSSHSHLYDEFGLLLDLQTIDIRPALP